jgi:hypothetical protein
MRFNAFKMQAINISCTNWNWHCELTNSLCKRTGFIEPQDKFYFILGFKIIYPKYTTADPRDRAA